MRSKVVGVVFAVKKTAAVMNTPAIIRAWAMAVTPKTYTLPIHIEKMMHHIHASTCMIRCPVATFGMFDRGLYFLLITEL